MQTPGGTVGWLPEIFGLLPEELQRRVATWNPEFLLRNVYKTRKTNIRAIEDGARGCSRTRSYFPADRAKT